MRAIRKKIDIFNPVPLLFLRMERHALFVYRRFFSLREIESSWTLQWMFGVILFGFFVTFDAWELKSGLDTASVADNSFLCWPYFQNCKIFNVLSLLPDGYSKTGLYTLFLGLMFLAVYFIWRKDWVRAHVVTAILFIWEFLTIFIFSASFSGNYDYYHIILAGVLLFLPRKDFFLKLTFVALYFLAGTVKLHEGWVLGTYFSSLAIGMPLFPDWSIPIFTNFVIFLEIVVTWFLLSSHAFLQRAAVALFTIFHLYSGFLVGYHYPAIVLPPLLVLFGPMYTKPKTPPVRKAFAGWIFVGVLFLIQSLPLVVSGDAKLTGEANKFGFYMFEANHQCISRTDVFKRDGSVEHLKREYGNARHRCNPYDTWFHTKQYCKDNTEIVERVGWTFDHSINGGPFYRIVNVLDACTLEYRVLQHNAWIKTPEEGASVIGLPVKNFFK